MASYDERVDTTFIGYLLIGFVLLLFGVMGLQDGGLFGELTQENFATAYKDLPIDYNVIAALCGLIGMVLILLTVFAYRTGNSLSAGIFAFFGVSLLLYDYNEYIDNFAQELVTYNSFWFVYVAIAIFFIVLALYAVLDEAPKLVGVLLLIIAVLFFFFALSSYFGIFGPNFDVDMLKTMGIVYGIFGFLGFALATYLGLAYAKPEKLPMI